MGVRIACGKKAERTHNPPIGAATDTQRGREFGRAGYAILENSIKQTVKLGISGAGGACRQRHADAPTARRELGAERVEFKTHARNVASRTALLGIGATFEGVLRHHTIMPDGSNRDSAFYGVIALTERAVTFWHPSQRK